MADLKISLRKKGATNFETGDRLLPVTNYNYVEGLIGPDGKISPSLIPAWLYNNRIMVGMAELATTPSLNIENILTDTAGFDIQLDAPVSALQGVQGYFVEVTSPGPLLNDSANADMFELIGNGNAGNNEFPVTLETGDYILLVKVNDTNPKFSFAIIDNVYGDATTVNKGIVKLYNGVNSESTTLAATAASVKAAHDLAYTKEDAFDKNTAFNKNFREEGTLTGNTDTVARGDHKHGTFGFSEADLAGTIIKEIDISDGIVTKLTVRPIAEVANAVGLALVTDLDSYVTMTNHESDMTDIQSYASSARILAKKGMEFYNNVAAADSGGHATGDIVIVQGS